MANVIFEAGEGRYEAGETVDGFFNLNKFIEENESIRPAKLNRKQYAPWIKANRIQVARQIGKQYFVTKDVIEALITSSLDERRKGADHVRVDVESDSTIKQMFDAITSAIGSLGLGLKDLGQEIKDNCAPKIQQLTEGFRDLTRGQNEIKEGQERLNGVVADIDLKLDLHAEQIMGLQQTDEELKRSDEGLRLMIEALKARIDQLEGEVSKSKRGGWGRWS